MIISLFLLEDGKRDYQVVSDINLSTSITNIEPSVEITDAKTKSTFNQNRNESESYFTEMFLHIEKAMSHALKDNQSEAEIYEKKNSNNHETSKIQFEELKNEIIKDTLCSIFEEKGYPRPLRCDIHVKLPLIVKKDVLSKMLNNLKVVAFLNFLEKWKPLIDNDGFGTQISPDYKYSISRYVKLVAKLSIY